MNVCTGFSHKHGGMNLDRSQKMGVGRGAWGMERCPKSVKDPVCNGEISCGGLTNF